MPSHEVKQQIRKLRRNGYIVRMTNNHLRITHPSLPVPVFAAGTPSDHRALHNLRAHLKRERRHHDNRNRQATTTSDSTEEITIETKVPSGGS